MIVAATSSDRVTSILSNYAKTLVLTTGLPYILLLGAQATAFAIETALKSSPGAVVYFFGHGVPPPGGGFVADCGGIVPDLTGISGLWVHRVLVGSFCYGERVGAHAPRMGFSMFGYHGPLALPSWPKYVALLEAAILEGPRQIAQGNSVQAAAHAADKAFENLAYRLNQTSDVADLLAAAVILTNRPTFW